jgi:hypothetical protein
MSTAHYRRLCGPAALGLALLLLFGAIPVATAQDWIYRVRSGDNLWNLAERYLRHTGYVARLQALNGVRDPYHLLPESSLRIPVAWMRTTPVDARVLDTRGDVRYAEARQGQPLPLRAGTTLAAGTRVITGDDSNATLEFHDGSRLVVQSDSELRLSTLRAYGDSGMVITRARLQQGRSETRVAPVHGPAGRFEIHTPAAVTAVRGTGYRVSADEAGRDSRIEVLSGKVAVTGAHRTRLVPAGYGTLAAAGRAPKPPIRLLPAPDLSALPERFERVPLSFSLTPLAGAMGYRVQVAAGEAVGPLLFDRRFPGARIRGIDVPDGTYLLRVRGVDSQGLEGKNAVHRFTLDARPEPPFLTEPAADGGVLEEQPQFAWSSQAAAVAFHFQLARDSAFRELLVDRPEWPDTHLRSPRRLEPGIYYWRVATRSQTEGRGPFSDPQRFRRPPPGPSLEPPDLSQKGLNVRWRAGEPGQSYQFQLARDPHFDQVIAQGRSTTPGTSLKRPSAGHYYMHVRTIDRDGYLGPYGPVQQIDIPCDVPTWLLMLLPVLAALLG